MDLTESEILNRWNDALKRAVSNAREMVDHSALSDKKRSMWNHVAYGLDELRRRGNIMAQSKALSNQELGSQIDVWEARISKKTEARATKEKQKKDKKRIILDG